MFLGVVIQISLDCIESWIIVRETCTGSSLLYNRDLCGVREGGRTALYCMGKVVSSRRCQQVAFIPTCVSFFQGLIPRDLNYIAAMSREKYSFLLAKRLLYQNLYIYVRLCVSRATDINRESATNPERKVAGDFSLEGANPGARVTRT